MNYLIVCMSNLERAPLQVRARDQSAQVSGYLLSHTSKTKRWRKKWYVVYELVLYEFERHEVRKRLQFHVDTVSVPVSLYRM